MSSTKSDLLPPTMTAPWTRPMPLADVPGGEHNLLHRSAWSDPANPLRVEFKPWYDDPPPAGTERVDVFLDDDESNIIGSEQWTLPMDPGDYFVEISADRLPSGEHTLSFIMTNFADVSARSFPFTVTVDKSPPVLASDSKLVFPPEVLPPNKLTARYLEQNGDAVTAALPRYTDPRPWDRITWFWGNSPGTQDQGGIVELTDQNYADPVVITIQADLIQNRGDGWRYVWYQAQDRAGNLSLRSEPVELDVAATPIPRTLPPSSVKQAQGGASSGVLRPLDAVNGVTVVIPPEAVIYDGEGVFVQWAEPGTVGAFRTDIPDPAGSRDYKIPKDKIAQHLGKTIPVNYEVFEPGIAEPHRSNTYSLRFEELTGLPTVQCDKVSGGKLSLASIANGGYANFTLERWSFMATDQFLTIEVRGVDSSNQLVRIPVLTEFPVPEVTQTLPAGRISKTDLQRLKIGNALDVRVSVSFDARQTWKTFPTLTPTLIA
ncbi:hypothetical protein [Pseudomonas sp. SMN5]|uniref:hypothetical protein n=1 Tax=Pseudomonas sp. SMN5 TaxID=3390198 RepID=UPI003F87F360